jgi:hypothetical protein
MLMHAAVDNEALVVPSPSHLVNPFSLQATLAAWLTATVLWLFAIFPLVQMLRTAKRLACGPELNWNRVGHKKTLE